jgi:hypothetical protein
MGTASIPPVAVGNSATRDAVVDGCRLFKIAFVGGLLKAAEQAAHRVSNLWKTRVSVYVQTGVQRTEPHWEYPPDSVPCC